MNNKPIIKIVTWIVFSIVYTDARIWYYGYIPLSPGSTVLDASESVDNVLISATSPINSSISDISTINTVHNVSTSIGQIPKIVSTLVQTYSMSSNTYILSGIQGQAYKHNSTNGSLYLSNSWNYTLNSVHYQLKSSKSGNQIFQIVVQYDSLTSSYSTDLNFINPTSLVSTRISIIPHYCSTLMPNQNGIAYVLCQNINSVSVLSYNQYGSFNGNITQNTIGSNYQIFVYNNYLGFSVDFQLFAYDANSFTKNWAYNFTSAQVITQITIFNAWLFALSSHKILVQFHVGVGMKFDQILINQTHIRLFQNFSDVMVLAWSPGNTSLSFYSMTNDYTCPGGCTSCWGGYSINATSLSCYVPVYTPPSPPLPVPPPPPVIPSIPIAPSTTNQTQNTTAIITKNQVKWCLQQDRNGYCYETCSIQCLICKQQASICVLCSEYYNLVSEGECQLNFAINFLAFLYSIANTFRIRQVQTLYLLINNLGLYQFHSTKYYGVIDIVFQITNFIKERSWDLLPITNIVQFLSTPIFWLKQYTPHTLIKFLQVQRANLTFLQNTKQYFLVYFPITFILFLLLNRLFYSIFNHKISYIFRCYSFWLYFVGIIVLVDIHKLSFLSCIQLKNLYSFYASSKWTQAVSVLLVGFWIAVMFAILPLYRYFYGNLDKYFYGNMKRIKYSLFIVISRSIAKPVIQGIAHACLLEIPPAQIVVLTFIQVIFFAFTAIFQVTHNLIKSKSIYCVEACIDLLMVLMNIVILIQYHDSQNQHFDKQAQKKLIQLLLKIIIIISSFLIGIDLILGIFQSFWEISRIRKKQNKFVKKSQDRLLNIPIYKQVGPSPSYKGSSFRQKIEVVQLENSRGQIQKLSENRRASKQNKSIKIKLNKLTMFNIMIKDQIQETQQQKFN